MSIVTYYAKDRGALVSGHAAGTQYQIEFSAMYPDYFAESKRVRTSLSGNTEELLYNVRKFYYIEIKSIITSTTKLNWDEFFTSVAAREIFQFDPTGTIASPGTDIDVVLIGEIPRAAMIDLKQLYRYSFTVEPV